MTQLELPCERVCARTGGGLEAEASFWRCWGESWACDNL